jgi:hypothetical protein
LGLNFSVKRSPASPTTFRIFGGCTHLYHPLGAVATTGKNTRFFNIVCTS